MKNLKDPIGNRSRDLPACSALPQPTLPPRTRVLTCISRNFPQNVITKFYGSEVLSVYSLFVYAEALSRYGPLAALCCSISAH
jgi:hypothetical protein